MKPKGPRRTLEINGGFQNRKPDQGHKDRPKRKSPETSPMIMAKPRKGVSFAKEAQITLFKKGKTLFTDKNKGPRHCIYPNNEGEEDEFELSISSPGSKTGDDCSVERDQTEAHEDIPGEYFNCFMNDGEYSSQDNATSRDEEEEAHCSSKYEDEGRNEIISLSLVDMEEGQYKNEVQEQDQPKALNVISPTDKENRAPQTIDGFVISRELVLMLKRNNLCIRPIVGVAAKKGSTAKKHRNREVTNLLRGWEKEDDIEPMDTRDGQSQEVGEALDRDEEVFP